MSEITNPPGSIKSFIERLVAAGCDPVEAGAILHEFELSRMSRDIEKRRAYERERKRKYRSSPRDMSRDNPNTKTKSNGSLRDIVPGHKNTLLTYLVSKKERSHRERKSGTICPADFKANDGNYDLGTKLGLSRQQVDDIAKKMIEWSETNANRPIARKANWNLALNGFIRRECPSSAARPQFTWKDSIL